MINEIDAAANIIKHPCRVIFTGRSTMGKTTLAVEIICQNLLKDVKRCFAVCPTFWEQPALEKLRKVKGAFTNKTVFTRVDDRVFEYIYQVISRNPGPTLLFIDDAAAEAATNKGNKGAFSRLALASPHLNLTIIGVFQRLSSCSPALRDNCEGLVSFVPTKIQDVDIIYKEFNPSPAHIQRVEVVKNALNQAWQNSRFCFIWRESFTGKIHYYSGFTFEINFHS